MLPIQLPGPIEQRLERLSEQTGRAMEFYVQDAILRYLEDLEDVEIAEQRLENLRTGLSTTVSLEEVMRQHGNLEG